MDDFRLDARLVGLGLRPPRLAVLVGTDCTWGHCVYLVGTLTQFWGGAACAIVPTDGQSISPIFWALLKRYDPDWVARYADTVKVSDSLWAELSTRLSLAHPTGTGPDTIWPDNVAWPLTGIHECLPDNEALRPVRYLTVKGELLAQTLVYASAGYLHKGVMERLEASGVELEQWEMDLTSAGSGVLELANDLWIPRHGRADAELPLWLSLRYVAPYTTEPMARPAIVAVCGDTLDDFAYFWTLRSLRGAIRNPNVFWIPRPPKKDGGQDAIRRLQPYIAYAVQSQLGEAYGDKRVLATSVSLPVESLADVGAALDKSGFVGPHESTKSAAVDCRDLGQLAPYDTFYWELNNSPSENVSVVQFLDGKGLAILNTPVPRNVSVKFGSNMRWMVDVEVEGLALPRRSSLTDLLVDAVPFGAYRACRRGIAYQAVKSFLQAYMTVESMTIRPRLKLPKDWQVFEALAAEAGLTLTLSDKGQFERELIRMMGGLEALADKLRDPDSVHALLRFIDDSPNKEGVHDQGAVIDKRRYLDLRAFTKLCDGDEGTAKALADSFLQLSLVERGLLIKCPHCRKSDWYPLAELSDKVVCHRCSREHIFSASASVYFRLDEIAREAMEQGSHIPLLTLDRVRRQSTASVLFSTACEIRREAEQDVKPWSEIDLLAVSDGQLVVGESKRGAKLTAADKKQLGKYVDLCGRLRADRFVLSTDAPEWSEASTAFLDGFKTKLHEIDVELVRLTGSDIGWPLATGDSLTS
jgi:hypothetical protein